MNSRERIRQALNHTEPDMLPVDFGSSPLTGMHVSIIYKLRKYFSLEDKPVKIIDPYQMLGCIEEDLGNVLGVDVTNLRGKTTILGFKNENWKYWELHDGTPVLVPGLFNTQADSNGVIFQYPEGDKKYLPSAKMPAHGYYFDSIIKHKRIDESELDPKDNLEEFKIISDNELNFLKEKAESIVNNTSYAVMGAIGSSGFGDIAFVPGPMLKEPKGIRDISEWYISLASRKDYIKKVFEGQCEIALENYSRINKLIGDKIDVVITTGTDFGTQVGLFISKILYEELFKPYHKKINDWIHDNTSWKSFIHSCGGIYELIPDLIDAGFDVLNPVQITAKGMDPKRLKNEFGKDIVFWGGGIDTQKTLPFGSPREVKKEARELIEIFSSNGGFIFSTVHNIQANIPIENLISLIEVIQDFRK